MVGINRIAKISRTANEIKGWAFDSACIIN